MRHLLWAVATALLLTTLTVQAGSSTLIEDYRYVRLWPPLQKPWYFNPQDLVTDDSGHLFLTDQTSGQVIKLTRDGQLVSRFGGDPAMAEQRVRFPHGIDRNEDGELLVSSVTGIDLYDENGSRPTQRYADRVR